LRKVKWGVIGVAKIATEKVIPAMQRGEVSEIAAIASRDLGKAQAAGDAQACRARFEIIDSKLDEADKEAREHRQARDPSTAIWPRNAGTTAMASGAQCIARASSCDEGLKYYKRYYARMLPGMKGTDKIATESWGTMIKLGSLKCK